MPSFLATVAGFMDWEFAEVMVQGYPARAPRGTTPASGDGPPATAGHRQRWRYCERPSSAEETPHNAPAEPGTRELRFAYVAGVTPGKWIRRWEERMPDVPLHS